MAKQSETTLELIEQRLRELPAEKLESVLDYVNYLADEYRPGIGRLTALASERSLACIWDRPEEDEAWKDL